MISVWICSQDDIWYPFGFAHRTIYDIRLNMLTGRYMISVWICSQDDIWYPSGVAHRTIYDIRLELLTGRYMISAWISVWSCSQDDIWYPSGVAHRTIYDIRLELLTGRYRISVWSCSQDDIGYPSGVAHRTIYDILSHWICLHTVRKEGMIIYNAHKNTHLLARKSMFTALVLWSKKHSVSYPHVLLKKHPPTHTPTYPHTHSPPTHTHARTHAQTHTRTHARTHWVKRKDKWEWKYIKLQEKSASWEQTGNNSLSVCMTLLSWAFHWEGAITRRPAGHVTLVYSPWAQEHHETTRSPIGENEVE